MSELLTAGFTKRSYAKLTELSSGERKPYPGRGSGLTQSRQGAKKTGGQTLVPFLRLCAFAC